MNLIKTVNQLDAGKISIKDAALLTKNFPFRKLRAEFNRILNEELTKGKSLENKIAGFELVSNTVPTEPQPLPIFHISFF